MSTNAPATVFASLRRSRRRRRAAARAARQRVAMLVGQSGMQVDADEAWRPSPAPDAHDFGVDRRRPSTTVSTASSASRAGGELIDSPGVRDYAPPVEDSQVQVGWPESSRSPAVSLQQLLHLRDRLRRDGRRPHPPPQGHRPSERVRERAAVDVFELAADRHAVRDAARMISPGARRSQRGNARWPRLRRSGWSRGSLPSPRRRAALPVARSRSVGTDAIERRQMPHQHEVRRDSCPTARSHDVRGRLDDAQQRAIARDAEQIGHNSASANMRQRWQWPTPASAFCSASRAARAPSRSLSSRWNAMRCADFGPTPGRQRRASMRRARGGG